MRAHEKCCHMSSFPIWFACSSTYILDRKKDSRDSSLSLPQVNHNCYTVKHCMSEVLHILLQYSRQFSSACGRWFCHMSFWLHGQCVNGLIIPQWFFNYAVFPCRKKWSCEGNLRKVLTPNFTREATPPWGYYCMYLVGKTMVSVQGVGGLT